ncbi:MAG: hypothetical protein ACSHX0_06905 [Akkermansiaceae bacterium]
MASLKVKVGADTSALSKGMRSAKGMIAGLGKVVKKVGLAAIAVGAAAAVAGLVGLSIAARGVREALNIGSRLSDVAANTGLLAGEVAVLERAFEDAGIAGGKVQPVITKMQRAMVEAEEGVLTYKRAFDALGLSLDDLRAMSPAAQFEAIQQALAGVQDPAERSARAMQIFGKSGADLGALLSNKGAMGNAAASVGEQADILNKNAEAFDRSADLLAGMKSKLNSFFVGVAQYINPVLLPVLEAVNKIDLASYGQAVGRFVSLIAEAFKQGAITGIIRDGLLIGAKSFVNFLVKGVRGVVSAMVAHLSHIPKIMLAGLKMLADGSFWLGMAALAAGLGNKMGQAFLNLIPQKLLDAVGAGNVANQLGQVGDDLFREGANLVKNSKASDYMAAEKARRDDMLKAFRAEFAGKDVLDTDKERGRMADAMSGLKVAVEENTKAGTDEKPAVTPVVTPDVSERVRISAPRVQSLARVGGAALAGRSEDLARYRNKLLEDIRRNTAKSGLAAFA